MTNYEKELQTMTIDEIAKYKAALIDCEDCSIKDLCDKRTKSKSFFDCYDTWEQWLESEVTENEP